MYKKMELDYKVKENRLAKELLSKRKFVQLVDIKYWETLSNDIKCIFYKTNLLTSFELTILNDAFKSEVLTEKASRGMDA